MGQLTGNEVDLEQHKLVYDQNDIDELRDRLAEQARVIAELRKNEDRYRSILESTNAVAWEVDVNTLKFTYVSPQIEALSGYPPEDWVDFDFWASKIHSDERTEAANWCQAETAKGADHEIEYRMIRADGSVVWVRDVISVISDKEMPVLLRGHFFEIDDRKKAEEESFALQAAMYRSQKMESLGLMASGIAHDFNNLLTVIMGNTELMLASSDPDTSAGSHSTVGMLEDIQKAGQQAVELIHEMLTYAGKDALALQEIDFNTLILDMWSLVERAHPKGVKLSHDLEKDLPSAKADPTLIQQVILNLIINASDALGSNIGSITLSTRLVTNKQILFDESFTNPLPDTEKSILVEVSDTGSGIEAVVIEKLFEPFFSTKTTGRGLGLATVLGIVNRHDGTISVKSKIGRGTVFSIYIPALEQPLPDFIEHKNTQKDMPYTKGTILVVDDEDGVRQMANRVLEHTGFSVLNASNGFEAIEMFKQRQCDIDCVLLDLRMPLMSGEETLAGLRKIDRNVTVVLVSGNYDPEDAAKLGVSSFVQKPYNMEIISRALSDAIQESAPV